MHPLKEAARRVAEQFDKNHQPLRLLMVNALVAIIETEIGPLFKRHQEMEATIHVLRDFLGAELDHDHTRAEAKEIQRKAFDTVKNFTGADALSRAWTRAKTAEARLLTVSEKLIAAEAERDEAIRWKNLAMEEEKRARDERDKLAALINTPETADFIKAAQIEAAHQRVRWPAEKDAGKTDADWFWLIGYLAGKALQNLAAGNTDKGLHHIITTAAACANWHRQRTKGNDMRPGIAEPFLCPACGRPWDTKTASVCECGAQISSIAQDALTPAQKAAARGDEKTAKHMERVVPLVDGGTATLPIESKREAAPCYGCERTRGWLTTQLPGAVGICPICKLEYKNPSTPALST